MVWPSTVAFSARINSWPGLIRASSRSMLRSSGPIAVERRQRAAEHVIAAAKGAGALERPEIGEVFDDADRRRVPLRVAADRARFDRIEIAADRARADRFRRLRQRRRQRLQQALAPLDQMQRRAPRRARPEAGQLREELDQRVEFGHRAGRGAHGRHPPRARARTAAARNVTLRTAASCRRAAAGRRSASASPVRRGRRPSPGRR